MSDDRNPLDLRPGEDDITVQFGRRLREIREEKKHARRERARERAEHWRRYKKAPPKPERPKLTFREKVQQTVAMAAFLSFVIYNIIHWGQT